MANINDAFPSRFLKVDDLQGRNVTVTIANAKIEEVGQGRDAGTKIVLGLVGKQKAFVCNKTNATTIAKLYGPDTDGWIGKSITLCPREVEFQGQMVMAIRVSLQAPAPHRAAAPADRSPAPQPKQAPARTDEGLDEDVPF